MDPAERADLTAEFIDVAFKVLKEGANPPSRPEHLFHFTDISGLIGIFQQSSLWASLATALNDQSEIVYGVDRARQLLKSKAVSAPDVFLDTVNYYLDSSNSPPGARIELRPFIISFCARTDSIAQWQHYGRAGAGVALGFDGGSVQKSPFDLVKVIYEERAQDDLLRSVIQSVATRFEICVPGGITNQNHELFRVVAHLTATSIWASAPRLKNRAFANEEEWRLVTYEFEGVTLPKDTGDIPMTTRFRNSGGRVIPYKKLAFETLPAKEIILGSVVPMDPEDPALALLVRNTVSGRHPKITRSTVPVRP